ncbi:MAG: hypothetical protein NVSMB26_26910 [Beijerinckiaceae bacterium]
MTDLGVTRPRAAVVPDTAHHVHSYVDWAAVLAGAAISCAIFVVLSTFGSAIGLSLTSPYPGSGFTGKTAAWAIGIWEVWVAVSSFAVGAYLAGRLRHRIHDATEHESDVRDSSHGLLVWALAALAGTYLISSALTGATHAAANADKANPARYAADTLLRTDRAAPDGYNEPLHRDVAAVLAAHATGAPIPAEDRNYLARTVAARTGAAQPDAERRVDAAVTEVREAANTARRTGIVLGFLTAASLAIGAAAAWAAAALGGRHRDEETDASEMFRWR